jgi:hypothetical protein
MFTSEKQKLQNLNLKEWLQEKKTIDENKKSKFLYALKEIYKEEYELNPPENCSECNHCYNDEWLEFEQAIYIIESKVCKNRYDFFKKEVNIEVV